MRFKKWGILINKHINYIWQNGASPMALLHRLHCQQARPPVRLPVAEQLQQIRRPERRHRRTRRRRRARFDAERESELHRRMIKWLRLRHLLRRLPARLRRQRLSIASNEPRVDWWPEVGCDREVGVRPTITFRRTQTWWFSVRCAVDSLPKASLRFMPRRAKDEIRPRYQSN